MKLFVGLNIVSILKRTSIERPLRRGSGSLVTLAQLHSAAAPGRLQGFYHLHEPMAEAPDSEKTAETSDGPVFLLPSACPLLGCPRLCLGPWQTSQMVLPGQVVFGGANMLVITTGATSNSLPANFAFCGAMLFVQDRLPIGPLAPASGPLAPAS